MRGPPSGDDGYEEVAMAAEAVDQRAVHHLAMMATGK